MNTDDSNGGGNTAGDALTINQWKHQKSNNQKPKWLANPPSTKVLWVQCSIIQQ